MAADTRRVAAALGNDQARRAFAHLALGHDEQTIIDDLGATRARKALQALRDAGLSGADANSVRPEVFRELLEAASGEPRPDGIERYLTDGRIDSYPVKHEERERLLVWALQTAIPVELPLTEAQVNERLAALTREVALLRRHLIDEGLLERSRDGSQYRRPSAERMPWGAIPWGTGSWTHGPVAVHERDGRLEVTAAIESDAWRTTAYGFVHDSEHALLAPFVHGTAVEVSFVADFDEEFDQAGIFVRLDERNWMKAGVEFADGGLQVGAVVTRERSDWSVAPVPEWSGRQVTVRASWDGDALTVRARADDEPFRLVRVVPLEPAATASAGPLLAAPTREGLTVRFTRWQVGEVDAALH
jgi:regulation of enolase protein 1 (concanavalin A-like superfamily)